MGGPDVDVYSSRVKDIVESLTFSIDGEFNGIDIGKIGRGARNASKRPLGIGGSVWRSAYGEP